VTIRFRLPEGVSLSDLPVAGARPGPEGHVEIRTEDELRVLHELTGWALLRGTTLPGLSVLRVSLEDVYLSLTGGAGSAPAEEPAGAGRGSEGGRRRLWARR
jgi:ABC-2 type transport system ATP-binding protein